MMNHVNGPLPYYQFEQLGKFPRLKHAIFTREGGVSKAPFNQLNVAFSVGDQKEVVAQNRERITGCLEISPPTELHQSISRGLIQQLGQDGCGLLGIEPNHARLVSAFKNYSQ